MLTASEALDLVLKNRLNLGTEKVSLTEAVGRILAEPIYADRDFPPFERVTMDGIAIWLEEPISLATFQIEATQYAGEPAHSLSSPQYAIEVMTGAVLPKGCNTVIRYEDIIIKDLDGERIAYVQTPIFTGQNIHHQGQDRSAGSLLVAPGKPIRSTEIGALASVGKDQIWVEKQPRLALISTGDELVDVSQQPLPHQIRRSNGYQLAASLRELGFSSTLFHLKDQPTQLKEALAKILQDFDILLMTGGVSAGKKDFVPGILQELGVIKHFHQIAQRPGKPMWFGTHPAGKAVFALPGNPVSTFACFLKYVRAYLIPAQSTLVAALSEQIVFKPDLTYYVPVAVQGNTEGKYVAIPLKGSNSGDFANLMDCTGFLELPADRSDFAINEVFPYIPFKI
ncbi:MAG: molybdopterin molybdotransferase MoeA [Siphonobacter sp.]